MNYDKFFKPSGVEILEDFLVPTKYVQYELEHVRSALKETKSSSDLHRELMNYMIQLEEVFLERARTYEVKD